MLKLLALLAVSTFSNITAQAITQPKPITDPSCRILVPLDHDIDQEMYRTISERLQKLGYKSEAAPTMQLLKNYKSGDLTLNVVKLDEEWGWGLIPNNCSVKVSIRRVFHKGSEKKPPVLFHLADAIGNQWSWGQNITCLRAVEKAFGKLPSCWVTMMGIEEKKPLPTPPILE